MSTYASQNILPQAIQNLSAAAQRLSSTAAQLTELATGGQAPAANDAGERILSDADFNRDIAAVGLTPEQRLDCERVIDVFETGTIQGKYGAISIFEDGPNDIRQVTYGRSQTTEYGNLRELVQMYVDSGVGEVAVTAACECRRAGGSRIRCRAPAG
jgi:chitosanase